MEKMVMNEWENDDSGILQALNSAYKKLGQFFFHNLIKQRYIRFVKSYNYLNKFIS